MSLTHTEFTSLLEDESKRIKGDIAWVGDEDHSPAWQFRAEVESDAGWSLFVQGRYNPLANSLSYVLILRGEGRICGLDLGKDHHNPQCDQVGEKHKHRWSEQYRDKEAYVPDDITASISDPAAVWKQFCAEVCLEHDGRLNRPPNQQVEIFS